jgi:hypothetical protein
MLAEENKNAGTSALEGKKVLQHLVPFAFAPLTQWQSLLMKRGKRRKRGVHWDLKRKSLCNKIPHALKRRELTHRFKCLLK